MNIAELFVRRPVMTVLVMTGILIFGVIAYRLLPVNALPNVDFPTIQVQAQLPGASPDTMASAVATPLEKQFSTIAGIDSMTSTLDRRHRDHHAAVLARPQHRCGGAGRAVGDRRRRALAALVDAHAADAAQGQPGRRADPQYRRCRRRRCRCRRSTTTPRTCWRSRSRRSAASRRSQVYGSQQYAVRIQLDPNALATRGIALTDVEQAVGNSNVNLPTGTLYGRDKATSVQATGQLMNAQAYAPMIVAYRNGAPVRLNEIGRVFDSVQNDKIAAWYNGTRGIMLARAAPAGNQHDRDRRRGQEDTADLRIAAAAGDQAQRLLRPLGVDTRRGARRADVAAARAGSGRGGDLRLPAQRLGDDHPQPRAAAVDHRHVRADVRVQLQPRQPVADGADAVRRLRRRRRDRDAGEHHAPHGDGQVAHAGDARRVEGDRLHDRLDDAVAGRGVHPGDVHGRHSRPPAARIRRHHHRRRADLGHRLADADADAVQPHAGRRAQARSTAACTRSRERVFDTVLAGYRSTLAVAAAPPADWCWRHSPASPSAPASCSPRCRRDSCRPTTTARSSCSPRRRRTSRSRRWPTCSGRSPRSSRRTPTSRARCPRSAPAAPARRSTSGESSSR